MSNVTNLAHLAEILSANGVTRFHTNTPLNWRGSSVYPTKKQGINLRPSYSNGEFVGFHPAITLSLPNSPKNQTVKIVIPAELRQVISELCVNSANSRVPYMAHDVCIPAAFLEMNDDCLKLPGQTDLDLRPAWQVSMAKGAQRNYGFSVSGKHETIRLGGTGRDIRAHLCGSPDIIWKIDTLSETMTFESTVYESVEELFEIIVSSPSAMGAYQGISEEVLVGRAIALTGVINQWRVIRKETELTFTESEYVEMISGIVEGGIVEKKTTVSTTETTTETVTTVEFSI